MTGDDSDGHRASGKPGAAQDQVDESQAMGRLASRLANLRKLSDRDRAQHPVSVLRANIAAQEAEGTQWSVEEAVTLPATQQEPSIEVRINAMARRLFSPILAQSELLAESIRREVAAAKAD